MLAVEPLTALPTKFLVLRTAVEAFAADRWRGGKVVKEPTGATQRAPLVLCPNVRNLCRRRGAAYIRVGIEETVLGAAAGGWD
jgi:hypothetical protein